MMVEPDKKGSVAPAVAGGAPSVQRIDGQFDVELGTPLPALDSLHAKAFLAHDRKDPEAALFALVVAPGIAWRGSALVDQLEISHPSLMRVRAIGPVSMPGAERRQAAIVLERPHGARLSSRRGKLKEEFLIGVLLPQLLDGLQALHAKRVRHRALRPDNLFFRGDRDDAIMIGEGLSSLPGLDQPPDFEPVERADASPLGRGEGTPACDLFALGVTLAHLLDATDPPETDPLERLIARIERGSFEVIAGDIKCSAPFRDLIAGLMIDDAAHRLTIAGVRTWIAAAGDVPRMAPPPHPSMRVYTFRGQNLVRPSALARLFFHHSDEACEEVQRGHLSRWVRSALGQPSVADEIEKLVGRPDEVALKPRPVDVDTVGRICCLIDPTGPVSYRGLSLMVDGFAGALSQAVLADDSETQRIIVDMITIGLPMTALAAPPTSAEDEAIRAIHNSLRNTLRWKKADAGIERVIYGLDHELPCLSPLVIKEMPIGPARYLAALERRLQSKEGLGSRPVDRHGEAYIAARLPPGLQKKARELGQKLRNQAGDLASDLATLSIVQSYFKADPVPHLAAWLAERLTSAFDGVHNKERRGRLIASLRTSAKAGDLSKVLDLLVDQREIHADNLEYQRALERYDRLGEQLEVFDNGRDRRARVSNLVGRQLAAAIAALIFAGASLSALLGKIQ